jgi:hypothetical protein
MSDQGLDHESYDYGDQGYGDQDYGSQGTPAQQGGGQDFGGQRMRQGQPDQPGWGDEGDDLEQPSIRLSRQSVASVHESFVSLPSLRHATCRKQLRVWAIAESARGRSYYKGEGT